MYNQPGGAPPVFVDRTGKRRRVMMIAGSAMGLGLLTSLGLILAGIFGDSTVPLPGWTDPRARPPVAGVDTPEELGQPASSTSPSRPSSLTSTAPVPTRTAGPPAATPASPAARPSASVPGQGDVRRTSKPSRSPGKPR
ncbi:hypothetical protein [Micromonospora sp. NPDC050200]|uniref:hypothetical protein n=1 Tax=Micromonospora sp. NPDC050200 TaxID=3155664 RepID=UPI0033C9399E